MRIIHGCLNTLQPCWLRHTVQTVDIANIKGSHHIPKTDGRINRGNRLTTRGLSTQNAKVYSNGRFKAYLHPHLRLPQRVLCHPHSPHCTCLHPLHFVQPDGHPEKLVRGSQRLKKIYRIKFWHRKWHWQVCLWLSVIRL